MSRAASWFLVLAAITTAEAGEINTPADAFAAGKAFGEAGKQAAQGTVSGASGTATVPHYNTAVPEADYYGRGRQPISGAGNQKLDTCRGAHSPDPYVQQECDAVNFLSRNPSVRPQYVIDKDKDPLLTGSGPIIANPGPAPGAPRQQCRVVQERRPGTYITETCTETFVTEYHECHKRLVVDCGATGCAPSGIRVDTVQISGFGGFLVHDAGTPGYWFVSAGTIQGDGSWANNSHFSGNFYDIYEANIDFEIVEKAKIETFWLEQVMWDDAIAVWLNDQLLFHSRGGTVLEKGCKITGYDPETGQAYENYWAGALWDGKTCDIGGFEGGGQIASYAGDELKPLLREGHNHVKIRVAIGKNGDAIVRFKTRAYCPCTKYWDNGCTALEASAQP